MAKRRRGRKRRSKKNKFGHKKYSKKAKSLKMKNLRGKVRNLSAHFVSLKPSFKKGSKVVKI